MHRPLHQPVLFVHRPMSAMGLVVREILEPHRLHHSIIYRCTIRTFHRCLYTIHHNSSISIHCLRRRFTMHLMVIHTVKVNPTRHICFVHTMLRRTHRLINPNLPLIPPHRRTGSHIHLHHLCLMVTPTCGLVNRLSNHLRCSLCLSSRSNLQQTCLTL